MKWLSDLEQKVQAAADELKSLRKENRAQKTKIKQLQSQLSEAKSAGTSSDAWEKEREAIRKRRAGGSASHDHEVEVRVVHERRSPTRP